MRDLDWTKVRLGDVAQISSGGTPLRSRKDYWNPGVVPWVKTSEVNFSTIETTSESISHVSIRDTGLRIYPAGTVLVAMYGDGVTRGRSALLGIPASINQACAAIVCDLRYLDPLYLRNFLVYSYAELRSIGHGSNQANLSAGLLCDFEISLPSINEQRRIAEILDAVDLQIASMRALILKQHVHLHATSRTMLNNSMTNLGRIESLGDLIGWQKEGFIQTGPFGSQLHSHEYVDDGTPVVMPQDITDFSISPARIARISDRKTRELSRHKMELGDVVFARRGDLSRCVSIEDAHVGWICGTGCLLVRLRSDQIDPEWLTLAYRDDFCQRQINAVAVGSTMVNLNGKILRDLRVPIPPVQVQIESLRILRTLRQGIYNNESQIEKMKYLKQGLMGDLLTGHVRVKDAENML